VIAMRITWLLAGLTLASPALAATLKPMGTVTGAVVRLSDLFEDVATGTDRVLGPAPAPGGRIVVEAAQLAAIARQFGVDWRPAGRGDRAILDRPGKPVARETVATALRAALRETGTPEDAEVELHSFASPLIPLDMNPDVAVAHMQHDPATGHFTALLSIGTGAASPVQARVAGRVLNMVTLAVPTRRITAGEVLRAEDLRLGRVRAEAVHADVARDVADAVGLSPRRPFTAGQPLPLADLSRPPAIRKGKTVLLLLDSPGITLTAQGQALEDGATGARIRILNPASRAVVEATVLSPDRARVLPASGPVAASAALLAGVR